MRHSVEFEQQKNPKDVDPLEDSELARRLRRMDWPTAAPEVKQRCLEEILRRVDVDGGAPPRPTGS